MENFVDANQMASLELEAIYVHDLHILGLDA